MAQGGANKLTKKSKSGGSQKRKQVKKSQKGRKHIAPKGRKAVLAKVQSETTRAIIRKNEGLISARAVGAGDRFFLSDIAQQGKKRLAEQTKQRSKKENRAHSVSDRLKDQLRKLGRDA